MRKIKMDDAFCFSARSIMHNRIKELRTARGWSMRELADRANSSASTINGLEKGKTQINVAWLKRLSEVFEVPPEEILGIESAPVRQISEDAAQFEQASQSVRQIKLEDAQFLYEAKTQVLDQLGILPGMILVVDMSPSAVDALRQGDVVVAQTYDGMSAVTILREFIAPSLLITNSSTRNLPIINTRTDDAVVKGVVVSSVSHFRRPD